MPSEHELRELREEAGEQDVSLSPDSVSTPILDYRLLWQSLPALVRPAFWLGLSYVALLEIVAGMVTQDLTAIGIGLALFLSVPVGVLS